jgi:PAS domain S-box-containing protein
MDPLMQGLLLTGVAALSAAVAGVLAFRAGLRRGRAHEAMFARELAELEAGNERLRRAERLAGIGEYIWNVETGALWWSENCYRLYGLDPADGITIERAYGAIHPDDADVARQSTEALFTGGPPGEHELRIVRPDGTVRHMLAGGELYLDGGQRHVFGVMKDVTDLAEVRVRLTHAEAQYRFLFEHNPLPMWVFDRETLRFLAVNDAMLAHYGYMRDDLIGASLLAIRPPEEAEQAHAAALAPGTQRPQGRVWTHLRKDGTRMRVALFVHDIGFDGRPARLVAAQDVTERERNEERFRLIVRATSDAVYDFDIARDHIWWSESFYARFGYSADTIAPTLEEWERLLHPDDAARISKSLQCAIEAPDTDEWSIEYRLPAGWRLRAGRGARVVFARCQRPRVAHGRRPARRERAAPLRSRPAPAPARGRSGRQRRRHFRRARAGPAGRVRQPRVRGDQRLPL